MQGLKKVLSSRRGQVDFPNVLVAFHTHLPDGQGPGRLVIFQLKLFLKRAN